MKNRIDKTTVSISGAASAQHSVCVCDSLALAKIAIINSSLVSLVTKCACVVMPSNDKTIEKIV